MNIRATRQIRFAIINPLWQEIKFRLGAETKRRSFRRRDETHVTLSALERTMWIVQLEYNKTGRVEGGEERAKL